MAIRTNGFDQQDHSHLRSIIYSTALWDVCLARWWSLPGLGPASSLSILLPLTIYLDPTGSIVMLAGCLWVRSGGSTTSLLVNIPGEASSVVTCFDGFQMTRQGRAGQALWIAAVGSFVAGSLGVFLTSFVGAGLARYGLRFGPPEYFGLLLLSMTTLVSLSGSSLTKGIGFGFSGDGAGSRGNRAFKPDTPIQLWFDENGPGI